MISALPPAPAISTAARFENACAWIVTAFLIEPFPNILIKADSLRIKPFAFNELSARIRALLRRDLDQGSPIIQTGEISLNTVTREVKRGNQEIVLTSKEYAILEYFMRNPKAILTRQMIENHIWNLSLDTESNVINVYIGRLRNKLNVKEEDGLIETIKGAGYRWRME